MERLTNRKTKLAKGGLEPSMIDVVHKLAEYEDLEEQGLLLKLPCKVGDTIFVIPSKVNYKLNILNGQTENNRIYKQTVHSIQMFSNDKYLLTTCEGMCNVVFDFYAETWFLTQAEAEEALFKL